MSGGGSVGEAEKWQESLARVVPAIVVLRVLSTGAFDSESPGFAKATGFVVDKERGIILTNRHVVTPGPTIADAVFMNKEEVDLVPIYYDPVHDFGFYRFDPKAVKFMEVAEIELNPEGAKVGVEIRVVGNDSGEKLSILPGILARLDRAAPEYDSGGYRDFNTFYLAAASSTSGGSSGSPVLTVDGKAVALNCGARVETAAAFYLPLPKIVRALELIQRGEKVTRGTLQTVLEHSAFDEARRLGLTPEAETLLRKEFPNETGVLVVREVLPKGPADGVLEPGDVVIRMNGEPVTTFLPWESALDDGVGQEVEVVVQRGGKEVTARMTVGDLQAITPSEFLEVSSSVLHTLSYQQARNYNLPVEGVYLAQAGYMLERAWISSQCIITSIGSDPTPDLDACEAALCKHSDGARVSVRYKALADRHRTKTAVITIDRKWFTMQRVRRNDEDGLWHSTPSPYPPSAPPTPCLTPCSSVVSTGKDMWESAGDGISSCLVMVVFDIPHLVDGVSGSYCIGTGVVVDRELGLVVVDRNTVQVSLGDVMLTFNGSEEVVARSIFSHPTHNFGVVQFDPAAVRSNFTAAVLASRETEHDEEVDGESNCVEVADIDYDSTIDNDDDESGSASGGSGRSTSNGETSAAAATSTADGEMKQLGSEGSEERAPSSGSALPTSPPPPQLQNGTSNSRSLPQNSTARTTTTVSPGSPSINNGLRGALDWDSEGDSPPPLRPGDTAEFYGLTAANAPVRQRAAVAKLERLSLGSSSHPQFTAHSVEVLQFDQITSCIGGFFIAAPRAETASAPPRGGGGGDSKNPSPGSSPPVVSAFWHSFAFSTSEGRKQTMRGLPAPVVRRAVDRLRRDLKKAAGSDKVNELENGPRQPEGGRKQGEEEHQAAKKLVVEVELAAEGGKGAVGGEVTAAAASQVVAQRTAGDSDGEAEQDAAEQQTGGCGGGGGFVVEWNGSSLLGSAPCLPLQLVTVELSKARAGLGLSDEWSSRIARKCGERRQKQVLEVRRCMAGTPAFSVVETGDIILAVNGKLVTTFSEVEVAVEEGEGSPVRLTILRELEERDVTVTPSYLPTRETDRLFLWAGLMVQEPHLAVLQLGFLPKCGGVYSSRWCYGSPAHKYSLGCTSWIVEVNGIPTPTLDAFLEAVKHIGDRSAARVKTVGLDSKVEVTTLRTDHHYWPTLELRRSEGAWTRTLHKGCPGTTPDTIVTTGYTSSTRSTSPSSSTVEATSSGFSCELPEEEPEADGSEGWDKQTAVDASTAASGEPAAAAAESG